jgi:hypothetical protein
MADQPKPRSHANPDAASATAASGAKTPKARKKITFFESIRRVEIAMRDLSLQECTKLVEYATMHVEGLKPKTTGEPNG